MHHACRNLHLAAFKFCAKWFSAVYEQTNSGCGETCCTTHLCMPLATHTSNALGSSLMNKVRGDTKTASQAWRKKPRKFAPKSRRGCKTCKIRRVKCDEARPWCMKCQSTGRTCDGYDADPRCVEAEVKTSQPHHNGTVAAANSSLFGACATINTQQAPSPCHQSRHSLTLQNLRPFMMLSAIAPEAMSFFELISVRHLNEYHPSESWRKTLMFFAQTVPSVRHAAVALALVHRNYHDGCATTLSEEEPLFHYNRAIQLLLAHKSGDGAEKMAITLLVCYLFTSFDSLAGNYTQAMTHLQGGVELSRNVPKDMLSESSASNGNILSGSRMLLAHVTKQIRRLDMQAVAFLVGWTPADIQETTGDDSLLSSEGAFESLHQAADTLQVLIAQTMRLQWVAQEASFADGVPSRAAKELVIGQLETWSRRFEEMLALRFSHHATADAGSYRLILLSRLQHTILRILVSGLGPGREMEYDRFLPAFQQCVAMADTVTAAHQHYAGSSKPAFTPEVAILPVLYIIGAKCRDPAVRRAVVRILRRQPLREAVWDSVFAARAVERIAEIEESRAGGARAESMDDIAVWQRIECVCWGQVVGGPSAPARMELEYTFCRQEGKHRESVVI